MESLQITHGKSAFVHNEMSFEHCTEVATFELGTQSHKMIKDAVDYFVGNQITGNNDAQLVLRHNDFMVEVNAAFFNVKLKELLDEQFRTPGDFELTEMYHEFKLDRIVSICRQSNVAFQHLVQLIAEKMIKYHFPMHMQVFLNRFLAETKSNLDKEEFLHMYDDALINYLLICDVAATDASVDKAVEQCLLELKECDYVHFVILCTHFPKFSHLLTDAM